jgi:hypothetical protein
MIEAEKWNERLMNGPYLCFSLIALALLKCFFF